MFKVALFEDRADGGRELARALAKYRNTDCVVYGLPRGGVVTAREVASDLNAPLDLLIPCKLSHPSNPEYAIGAVSEEGDVVLNDFECSRVPKLFLDEEVASKVGEARARHEKYLGDRTRVPVQGKTAIVADDGIATGYTMRAAIAELRRRGPARIVVAAPVAPADSVAELVGEADEVVVPNVPEDFFAIGVFYERFAPVEDDDVVRALHGGVCEAGNRLS